LEVKDPVSFLLNSGKSSWHIKARKLYFSSAKRGFFSYVEHFFRGRETVVVFAIPKP
jgi:hypothetical protein